MTVALYGSPPVQAAASLFRVFGCISGGMNASVDAPSEDAGDATDPTGDLALVAATLGGDDGAFAELIRRHKHRVFGLATRFARDAHEREDLCQEIFVQAYRKLRNFRGESPFIHWLSRLAVRKCYDLLRKTRRERQTHVPLDETHDSACDEGTVSARRAREAREILAGAMTVLSADERLVITLLELEDCPVREIASLTGWSEANVRTRAYRARAALKKVLALQGFQFP